VTPGSAGAATGPSREDVEFTSHGAVLRGWLYRPPGGSRAPGIVMAHGLSAVREMFLDRYADAFARAGFTTLVYDHFGFGASDGDPRQLAAPSIQLAGYRDAIAWLARHPAADGGRIGIWGSSFSGGEVIVLAAEDLPIRCAVAQLPGFMAGGPGLSDVTIAAIRAATGEDRDDATVPAVSATADGLGVMYADGASDWFTRVAADRAPGWRNELRVSGLVERFRPVDHLAGARVPLLLVVAPADTLTPPGPGVAAAAPVPGIEIVEIAGGHFDAYEAGFAASSEPAIAWYRRHLTG
jgi:dienelactone hydrolase